MLIICSVLDVTPYELHGGANGIGSRSNPSENILVTKDSEYGRALMQFLELEWRKEGRAGFSGICRHCWRYGEKKE